jgi:hypothetical protein
MELWQLTNPGGNNGFFLAQIWWVWGINLKSIFGVFLLPSLPHPHPAAGMTNRQAVIE